MKDKIKKEKNVEFGKYLKSLREKQNLSQAEAAEKAHVSLKDLEIWENELDYPRLNDVYNLADIYWVTCDEMLRKREESIKNKSIIAIILSKIFRIYINWSCKTTTNNYNYFDNSSFYFIWNTYALKIQKKLANRFKVI